MGEKTKKKGSISYAKWGYIFIAPFFIIFAVFQLIPLISTIYYSFFEYYRSGLKVIGPNFAGLKNYITLFSTDLPKYFSNTLILWIIGFIPQIAISLLLAAWFTDLRLKLKGQTFFKTVIYMPNLIMASAFAMLFFALFSDNGPVNAVLMSMGWITEPISFLNTVWGNRALVGLMNFLMWFGNTTIMLMAAIMGVDPTLYEAAELDGCTPNQMFWKITIPLIRPILVYVMITSMIGGLQMFDVPQILTNGKGGPDRTSTTMIMYLNNHLFSKNYGMAGAVSVVLFLVCAVLCVVVYFSLTKEDDGLSKAQHNELKAAKKVAANPEKSIIYGIKEDQEYTFDDVSDTMSKRQIGVLVIMVACFGILIYGLSKLGWYFEEMSALFIFMGIICGFVNGYGPSRIAKEFGEGAKGIVVGCLIIGIARTVEVILSDASILDTIVYGIVNIVGVLPNSIKAVGMFLCQSLINCVIVSGTGQAAVTMPLMVPVSDLVGISRQTAVLAFQLGDGFSNSVLPMSSSLMGYLAVSKIPYSKWLKFMLPLFGIWTALGCLFMLGALMIGY